MALVGHAGHVGLGHAIPVPCQLSIMNLNTFLVLVTLTWKNPLLQNAKRLPWVFLSDISIDEDEDLAWLMMVRDCFFPRGRGRMSWGLGERPPRRLVFIPFSERI